MTFALSETALNLLLCLTILAVVGVVTIGCVYLRRNESRERKVRQAEITCRRIHTLERDAGLSYSACLSHNHCAADVRAELRR